VASLGVSDVVAFDS
jgi:hypothetical protein